MTGQPLRETTGSSGETDNPRKKLEAQRQECKQLRGEGRFVCERAHDSDSKTTEPGNGQTPVSAPVCGGCGISLT